MKLILQPEGSTLCGESCIAMVAGISLRDASNIVGGRDGTHTSDIVSALRALGIPCAEKLHRISRTRPAYPQRAILHIKIPRPSGGRDPRRSHWMLTWDGIIYDPGGRWPDGYPGWRITSYLDLMDAKEMGE